MDSGRRVAYWPEKSDEKAPPGAELIFCAPRAGFLLQSAGSFFVDLLAVTFSAAKTCFTASSHRILVKREYNPRCFRLVKTVLLRQFALAALNVGTNISLSEKRA